MTVKTSDCCDGTSTVTIFNIASSVYFYNISITTLRVAAALNIPIIFCLKYLCSCRAFLTARTLTTVNPTQFLGFGKNFNLFWSIGNWGVRTESFFLLIHSLFTTKIINNIIISVYQTIGLTDNCTSTLFLFIWGFWNHVKLQNFSHFWFPISLCIILKRTGIKTRTSFKPTAIKYYVKYTGNH